MFLASLPSVARGMPQGDASPHHPGTPMVATAMTVVQVLQHVTALTGACGSAQDIEHLMDAADACGHLVGTRRRFFEALKLHQRVERLACVAAGRERQRPTGKSTCPVLRSAMAAAQACVDDEQRQWWRIGQRFTRLTHLLPTQLGIHQRVPPGMRPMELQGLMSVFVRSGAVALTGRFDTALEAYMRAHGRCQAQVAPVRAARERRLRAQGEVRGGRLPLGMLARAMLDEFLVRQPLLLAEAERAGAHHGLHVLADLTSFLPS